MTSSEKPRQFCMKSQLILIARWLSINNQKLVDLLFQPLTRKHVIRGDAFSKSFSIGAFSDLTLFSVLNVLTNKYFPYLNTLNCFDIKWE